MEGLAYFNMKFDITKSQFIRFGNCSVSEITLWSESQYVTKTFSESVR